MASFVLVAGATPHPGATLTEPAVLAQSVAKLPATYIHCVIDEDELDEDLAELDRRRGLATGPAGHRPLADVLPAA